MGRRRGLGGVSWWDTVPPQPPPSGTYQLEHPGAATAGGEAAESAQQDHDDTGTHQDEGHVGGLLIQQGEVDGQAHPAPDAHGQQHDARHLGKEGKPPLRSAPVATGQRGRDAPAGSGRTGRDRTGRDGPGSALTQKTKV